MARTFEQELLLRRYKTALETRDLTQAQRDALSNEIARLEGMAEAPEELPVRAEEFPTVEELRFRREREAEARAEEAVEARRATLGVEELEDLELTEYERALEDIQRERAQVIVPGAVEPVPVRDVGFFRPTRIVKVREEPALDPIAATRTLLRYRRQLENLQFGTAEERAAIEAQLPDLERAALGTPTIRYLYRDPETGELREPSPGEELRESLRAQQIATEEEAQRIAGRGEAPMGILEAQERGQGIVETPLGQTLRGVLGLAEATLGEAYVRGLGFEVDEEGNPRDPEDFAYKMRQMNDAFKKTTGFDVIPTGISPMELAQYPIIYPLGAAEAAVAAPLRAAGVIDPDREAFIERYRQYLRNSKAAGFVIPGLFSPSESTTRQATFLDPEGRVTASDIEVPSFFEDPVQFLAQEQRRIARNTAAGRGILDEVRSSPDAQTWATKAWHNEDVAYAGGIPLLFLTPATPVGVAVKAGKTAATGLRAGARTIRGLGRTYDSLLTTGIPRAADYLSGGRLAEGQYRLYGAYTRIAEDLLGGVATPARAAARAQAEKAIDFAASKLVTSQARVGRARDLAEIEAVASVLRPARDSARQYANSARALAGDLTSRSSAAVSRIYNQAAGAAIDTFDKYGGPARSLWIVSRPGADSDALVNRRVTEAVLRSSGISDDTISSLMKRLDFRALRTGRIADTGLPKAADEAHAKIFRAIEDTGIIDDPIDLQIIERMLLLNIPEDYVMVTDTFAAPRAYAARAKEVAQNYVRESVRATAGDFLDRLTREAQKRPTNRRLQALLSRVTERVQKVGKDADALSVVGRKELSRAMKGVGLGQKSQEALLTTDGVTLAERMGIENIRNAPLREGFIGPLKVEKVNDKVMILPFSEQPNKAAIIERLTDRALTSKIGGIVRRSRDLGQAQIYLNTRTYTIDNIVRGLWDTPFSRSLLAVVRDPTVSDLTQQGLNLSVAIRRAGRLAETRAARNISAAAKVVANRTQKRLTEADTVSEALDTVVREGAEEFGLTKEQVWEKAFSLLYGETVNRDQLLKVLEGRVSLVGVGFDDTEAAAIAVTSGYPTVSMLKVVDEALAKSAIQNMARPIPGFGPDYQKVMLGIYMDEILKREIAGEVMAETLVRQGLDVSLWQEVGGTPTPNLRSLILDPKMRSKAAEIASDPNRKVNVEAAGTYGFATPDFGADRVIERKLAEAPWEFVEYTGPISVRGRQSLGVLAKEGASYVAGNMRLNLIQAMKYGYFMPNLRTAAFKGLTAPFVAMFQLGASKGLGLAAKGAAAATGTLAREIVGAAARKASDVPVAGRLVDLVTAQLKQRNGGIRPGLVTQNGVYYSGEELIRLAELNGVGFTSVSAERVYSLAEDILHAVRQSLPRNARPYVSLKDVSPLQKTFWMKTAEAMDRSFRQGAFEARIAAGDSVEEAAKAARDILFDYDEVPDLIRQRLGGVFQGAGTLYKLTTATVIAGMKNPRSVAAYIRALEENQRRQDPYKVGGDATLLNFVADTEDGSYLIRVPGAGVADTVLNIMLFADVGVKNMAEVARVIREQRGADLPEAVTTVVVEGPGVAVYAGFNAYLNGVLGSFAEFEPVGQLGMQAEGIQRMSDEKLMWAILLQAKHHDPDSTRGIWNIVWSNLDPVRVDPPSREFRHSADRYARFWTKVPENKPHLYWGQADDGQPLYVVVEPSERGQRLMSALRSTPPNMQAAYAAGVGLYYGNDAMSYPGIRPQSMYAPGIPTDPVSVALSLIANPTFVDYRGAEPGEVPAERIQQAKRYLEVREQP